MSNDATQNGVHLLTKLKDTELRVSVVLMEKQFTIGELTSLCPGSILRFDTPAVSPALLNVNGKHVAKGRVMQVKNNFGIEIEDIL